MIKRNDKCEYCGKDMISKSIRKRFCSAKCRVYSKREKVYAEKYPPKIEVKSAKIIKEDDKPIAKFELEVIANTEVVLFNKKIEEQIAFVEKENIPPERDKSSIGRKSWRYDQQQKIEKLRRQLKSV